MNIDDNMIINTGPMGRRIRITDKDITTEIFVPPIGNRMGVMVLRIIHLNGGRYEIDYDEYIALINRSTLCKIMAAWNRITKEDTLEVHGSILHIINAIGDD